MSSQHIMILFPAVWYDRTRGGVWELFFCAKENLIFVAPATCQRHQILNSINISKRNEKNLSVNPKKAQVSKHNNDLFPHRWSAHFHKFMFPLVLLMSVWQCWTNVSGVELWFEINAQSCIPRRGFIFSTLQQKSAELSFVFLSSPVHYLAAGRK